MSRNETRTLQALVIFILLLASCQARPPDGLIVTLQESASYAPVIDGTILYALDGVDPAA